MKIIVFYLEINVLSQRYVLILCTVFVEIFFQPIYLNIQSNHCVMMAIHWHFVVSVKLLEFWFLRSRLMLPHNHKTILTRAIFSCRRIEREIERGESGDRWKLCEQSWLWKIGVQSRGLFLGVQELLFESSKEIWGLGCFAASKNVVRGWSYLMSLSNWRGSNMWRLVLVNRKCFITHSYCQLTIR